MADDGDIPGQEPVAMEDDIGSSALPMDKYHLPAPIFLGEDDVEQFITEFSDVVAICRWPTRITLIQLRLCLTGSGFGDRDRPGHRRHSRGIESPVWADC